MNKKSSILALSITINALLVIGIVGNTAWKYYKKMAKPFRADYYEDKVSHFTSLQKTGVDIVFLGDSQTDRCEWTELFDRCDIINRGIDGDTTDGVLNRLGGILSMKPKKIFIMIGGADIIIGRKIPRIEENYKRIISRIRAGSPQTNIFIQSVLPVVRGIAPMPNDIIRSLNGRLLLLADNRHVFYINIYGAMADTAGGLNPSYSTDGVHLNGKGYLVWRDALLPYIK